MAVRTLAAAALAAMLTCSALADRPCPPDTDCSGGVNVGDLVAVVLDWGAGAGDTDVDGSGTVDVGDLVEVILAWGPCRHDFGPGFDDAEAEQIALEMLGPGGPLQVPPAIYERVDRDLDLIRAAVPDLVSETHTMAWAPNQLIVQVNVDDPTGDYECLNTYYRVVAESVIFSNFHLVTFAGNTNVERMVQQYLVGDDVLSAEPNGLIGGQNFWTPVNSGGGVWTWTIDDGWQDCFDGCDCHRVYTIETDEPGNLTVLEVVEFGQSWCEFK